jgi:hypothetical protein
MGQSNALNRKIWAPGRCDRWFVGYGYVFKILMLVVLVIVVEGARFVRLTELNFYDQRDTSN